MPDLTQNIHDCECTDTTVHEPIFYHFSFKINSVGSTVVSNDFNAGSAYSSISSKARQCDSQPACMTSSTCNTATNSIAARQQHKLSQRSETLTTKARWEANNSNNISFLLWKDIESGTIGAHSVDVIYH